jgi:hypothetical protein
MSISFVAGDASPLDSPGRGLHLQFFDLQRVHLPEASRFCPPIAGMAATLHRELRE